MRRIAILALLAVFAAPARADFDYSLYRRLTMSMFKVEAMNPDGSVSLGTGVAVAPGIVATNCHVTRRAAAVELVQGALRRTVQSQESDMEHDLCLLHAPAADDVAPVPLSRERLRTGQPLMAVGFIGGIGARLNAGEVVALYEYDGGQVIQSTTHFNSGASGGGLFDASGRLVGLLTFRARGGNENNFSIPVSWIVRNLEKFDGRPIEPLTGVSFWQRGTDDHPFFLRAATLEAQGNWNGLVAMAREWSFAEADNPSSWLALGKAHYHMNQNDDAIRACHHAVTIDPDLADAWYNLGLAYLGNGADRDAERVYHRLRVLNPQLAEKLSKNLPSCNDKPTVNC